MLDVVDFIADRGGDPNKIRESQRLRNAPESAVDEVIALYEEHRRARYAVTQIGTRLNTKQKEIGMKKKAKEDATSLLQEKADLDREKKTLEDAADKKEVELNKKINTIGNYVDPTVPEGNDEANNKLIRDWAPPNTAVTKRDCMSHHDVMTRLEMCDFDRGVKVVGHRGNFRTGVGVRLRRALEQYALDFLAERGYIETEPPSMMLKKWMARTAQLEQFDEELYKVGDGADEIGTEKYLIATAEQPLSALRAEEWLTEKELPIKLAGVSPCFRKEAGAHGKDAWGLFRTHEFQKVEQFVFSTPEASWPAFDSMIETAEAFYQSLQLPYRVVAIVSGALNNAAAKKYDLEAWFPFQGEYKELVSCSNCTDYQSRALEIRCGQKALTGGKKKYVHLLNCTLCATGRALCCLVENMQTDEGIHVPEPLRRYMIGQPAFLPFTKDLGSNSTSARENKKKHPGIPVPAPGAPTTDHAATSSATTSTATGNITKKMDQVKV